MARKRKTILVIAVLVGLTVLLPLIAALSLNSTQAKSIITSWIESRSGREFSIDGRLGMAMGLSTTIVAHDVRLSNSDWALADDMISIDRLSVTLSVTGLLKGEGLIREIHVRNPILRIERHPGTGKFNVDLHKSASSDRVAGAGLVASQLQDIRQVSIDGGQVIYYHPRRRWEFDITNAVVRSPALDQPMAISLSGAVEKTPVVLSGQTGSLRSVIDRVPTEVDLQGHIVKPENTLFIAGVIEKLRGWQGLNLRFETLVANLSDLSELIGVPLYPWRDISASWNLVQPGRVRTLRMDSIEMSSPDYGLQSSLKGQIGYLPRFRQMELDFSAKGNFNHGALADKLNQDIALETDIEGTLTRGDGDLSLTLERGAIRSVGMKLDVTGTVESMAGDWASPLQASLKMDDLTALGSLINRDLPSVPHISASGNIYRLNDEIRIFDILLENDSPQVKVLAVGSLENPGARQRGVIDFSVQSGSDLIERSAGSAVAGLVHNLTVAGTVRLDADEVSIPDIRVDAKGQGIQIDGSGEFGSVGNIETLRIALQGSIQGLDKLSGWVGQSLPPTEPVTISAQLSGDERRKLNLGNIQANLEDPAIRATLSGEIRNLGKSPKLILNFETEVRDAEPFFSHWPGLPMDQFGALVTELLPARSLGKLRTVETQDGGVVHSMEELKILSGAGLKSRVAGGIDHLFTSHWSGSASLRVYGELEEGVLPPFHDDLVALHGYLDSAAEVSVSGQGIVVEQINARLISGYSETRVSGKIESWSPFATTGLEVMIDRPRLDDLLAAGAWPALARDVPVQGQLVYRNVGQPGEVSFDLKVADSDLAGRIYLPAETSTSTSIQFTSQNMDLIQLLPASPKDSPGFFPRNHIRLPWMDDADMSIKADFGRLKNRILQLDQAVLDATVHDGRLSSGITGKSGDDGSMDIRLSLHRQPQGKLQSRAVLTGNDIELSALAGAGQLDHEQKGVFSLQADIDGSGHSISEIMGSADGQIRIGLQSATLKNQSLRLLGGDLFMGLLTVLNPLTPQEEIIYMDCGVINFDLENGVASNDRGIALKTTDFTLLGGGKVDFAGENLDLEVSTKARKGLGVNAGSFARLLLVKGTIDNPEIRPGGLLESGVSLGVGYLTGGLSLFARGLFDLIEANSDVCATAMAG